MDHQHRWRVGVARLGDVQPHAVHRHVAVGDALDVGHVRVLAHPRAGSYACGVAPGEPASYLTLEEGTEVLGSDGERVGVVQHVLADIEDDIFDGIVIDTSRAPGGLRFVDAPEVAEIRTDAVVLSVASEGIDGLPEPAPNPAVMEHHGAEDSESELRRKLGRAWDMISGKEY